MKMKFLVISSYLGQLSKDLKREIEKHGHSFSLINVEELVFSVEQSELRVYSSSGEDLLDFDVYIFRAFGKNLDNARIFASKLREMKKMIIDDVLGKDYIHSKLQEANKMTASGIGYPKTVLISKEENLKVLNQYGFNYPLIVKSVAGSKGSDMELVYSEDKLLSFFKKDKVSSKNYLIQEFLEIDGDVRVLVIGDKALGAIKRFVIKNDFRSNASLGAEAKEFELTKEIEKLAIAATKAMNYDMAGVDLIETKEGWKVLEVNISPQWSKFQEVTGKNVAKEVVDYILRRKKEEI